MKLGKRSGYLATSLPGSSTMGLAKEMYGFPKDARKVTYALEASNGMVVSLWSQV